MAIKVKAVEGKLKFTKNENDPGGSTAMCWALSSTRRCHSVPGTV